MTDPRRFTDYYIWGTVAFVAADLMAGLNLRIPGLTHEPRSLPSVLDQGLEPADAVMGVSEVVGVGLAGAVFLSGVYVGLGQARSPQGG